MVEAARVLSPVEELRAAAHAMDAEADSLDSLDRDASAGPWSLPADEDDVPILAAVRGGWPICRSPDDGVRGGHDRPDAVLIVACLRAPVTVGEVTP